jgi:hypothetical protein
MYQTIELGMNPQRRAGIVEENSTGFSSCCMGEDPDPERKDLQAQIVASVFFVVRIDLHEECIQVSGRLTGPAREESLVTSK